jgi:hypothetical protein
MKKKHIRKKATREPRRAGKSSLPILLAGAGGVFTAVVAAILCQAFIGSLDDKLLPLDRKLVIAAWIVGAGLLPVLVVVVYDLTKSRRNRR